MAETYLGEVKNGVVVFEEGTPHPPDGSRVRVELTDAEALADLSTSCSNRRPGQGSPADMAEAT